MKIRRTLPSVNQYSPINRKSSALNLSENKDKQFPTFLDIGASQTLKKVSSSPQKRIFGVDRSSSKSKKQFEDSQKRKTVSFIDPVVQKVQQAQLLVNKSVRSLKKQRRSRIFTKEDKNTNNTDTIPANISLKWISQQLKKSTHLEVEEKLTKKIAQLEEKVNGMSGKVEITQVQEIKRSEGEHFRNYSEIDSNVLKLQLEQMRRCEKIAKENEILYSKLIKNIEVNENQLVNSRKRTYSSYQISPQKSVGNFQYAKGGISAKITAFQDFDQFYNKNLTRDLDQSEAQLQISSPFSLQENKGKIKVGK